MLINEKVKLIPYVTTTGDQAYNLKPAKSQEEMPGFGCGPF